MKNKKDYLPFKEFYPLHKKYILNMYKDTTLVSVKKYDKELLDFIKRRMFVDKYFEIKEIHLSFFENVCDNDDCVSCSICDNPISENLIHPEDTEWLDIEGIGYGWIAISDSEHRNRVNLYRSLLWELNNLINMNMECYHFTYKDVESNELVNSFYLTTSENSGDISTNRDIIFRTSKKPLYLWGQ